MRCAQVLRQEAHTLLRVRLRRRIRYVLSNERAQTPTYSVVEEILERVLGSERYILTNLPRAWSSQVWNRPRSGQDMQSHARQVGEDIVDPFGNKCPLDIAGWSQVAAHHSGPSIGPTHSLRVSARRIACNAGPPPCAPASLRDLERLCTPV